MTYGALKMLTVTLGGLNFTFCAFVCILRVFLCDTLLMVAEAA